MTRYAIAFSISLVLHVIGIIYYLYHPSTLFPPAKSEPKSMSVHLLAITPESIKIQQAQPMAEPPEITQPPTQHPMIAQANTSDHTLKPLPAKKKNAPKNEHSLVHVSDTNVSLSPLETSLSTQEAKSIPSVVSDDTTHPNIDFQKITQAIEKMKEYPEKARKRNIEGVVNVTFVLTPSGEIESLESLSHSTLLANSAKETILKAKDIFPKPNKATTIRIPLTYILKK